MAFWRKTTLLFCATFAVIIWHAVFEVRGGELEVYFFDVGQGDAIFIETPSGNQVLIDGGPDKSVVSSLSRVMPFYDRSIDIVILTHPHSDHFAGLIDVFKRYEVDLFIENGFTDSSPVYQELEYIMGDADVKRKIARAGERILLDQNLWLDIISPADSPSLVSHENPNEATVVGRLVYSETAFLFTGDMEKTEEVRLASSNFELESNILKVAHHGSKNSSTLLFLEKVAPSIAVVSSGKNRYGHPHQEALDRLASVGAKILRTDEQSTIVIKSYVESFVVSPDTL